MGVTAAVFAGFVLATVAPSVARRFPDRAGWLLALLPATIFCYLLDLGGGLGDQPWRVQYTWAPSFGLSISFLVDGLGLLFALVISGMGAIVLVYSTGYMAGHEQLGRFYALLLMFQASMLGLVLSDNVLTLFVFWELTSLSSFFLIGFEHHRRRSRDGAWQALLLTSGGGLALLVGLLLLGQAGSAAGVDPGRCYQISALVASGARLQDDPRYLPMLLLILVGAFTKSAQFPFHFWLPNAMEAPTPVSAYLHSATMVKAGVYLLARLSPLLGGSDAWLWIVAGCGAATALSGGLLAVLEQDLKRILAYSTISALGLMVLLIGLGSPQAASAALVFLLAHALYKGGLFLVAGILDHQLGTRHIGRLGGLAQRMPITAAAALFAALSMAAVPPWFGFLGKEMMYEATLEGPLSRTLTAVTVAAGMLFVVVAVLTGVRPFVGRPVDRRRPPLEAASSLWLGPAVLGLAGIAFGLAGSWGAEPLMTHARAAMFPHENLSDVSLELWHGWNTALLLGGLTLAGGGVLYALHRPMQRLGPLVRHGPNDLYDAAVASMLKIARLQTRILQSGYQRWYTVVVLLTTVGLLGYQLAGHGTLPMSVGSPIRWIDAGLGMLILLATLVILRARSPITAILALGVAGYGIALVFALRGAPDLAMSQFLIETLTVILFVLVFHRLPLDTTGTRWLVRIRDGAIALAFGGSIAAVLWLTIHADGQSSMAEYFIDHSLSAGHGRNVVNVILVDFRALDTLGEIVVLSIAGLGVYALLKLPSEPGARQ